MGKFGRKTLKRFVLNETWYKVVFNGTDSNLTIAFVNPLPKIPFGTNLSPKPQTVLSKLKRSTKGNSRGLISNAKIVILNSVPKIPFLGIFGCQNSKSFVLSEIE